MKPTEWSRYALLYGIGFALSLSAAAKSPSKVFVPAELASAARNEPLANFKLSVEHSQQAVSDYRWLSIAIDDVLVASPDDWTSALQTMERLRHNSVVVADVYVRPGPHRITYQWLANKSVPEYRTFGSSETIGGAVDRTVSGFILAGYHNVAYTSRYEEQVTLAAKQTSAIVPDPTRISLKTCAIDGRPATCDTADQFVRDHPQR